MKKTIAILSLMIFTTTFSACTWFEDSDESFEDLDSAMETLAEQYMSLLESKAELTILVTESDDSEEIFEQFHKVDSETETILRTIEYLEEENERLFAQALPAHFLGTAYASEPDNYGVDTGLQSYGIMGSIGNFLTDNQYRDQDEAMRMGIYTAYKDIENTFPGDAETHIDPILEELGVDKIEDILYCELDKVETFYNSKIDQLPEGYGANFKSYKNEMYETLREGDAQDMYAYMDNVTAIIDDEIEEGEYGEYVPKHIADFMIRTIGHEEFGGYIEERRENQLKLQNEVAEEDDWEEPDLADFLRDEPGDHVGDNYYGDDYDKDDDKEVIIAFDEETGQLIISEIDTDDANGINLPEGSYVVYATADGNLPVSAEDVVIQQGQTTTVNNTTVKNVQIDQDLLNFIISLGQTQITLPTKEEMTEKQEELEINKQLKEQLEHQLEILKSMEGGTFTRVTPEARDKINAQLSEVNKNIRALEDEVAGYEVFIDILGDDDDDDDDEYAEFIQANGNWNGYDSGSISVEFASDGGPVTAYFGGCPGGTCWSSTATGYYDGGEGGSVSGNIDGYMEADEYTDAKSIWGSFSGNIYLAEEYASGTFSLSVGEYGDSGTWYASFDNGLGE